MRIFHWLPSGALIFSVDVVFMEKFVKQEDHNKFTLKQDFCQQRNKFMVKKYQSQKFQYKKHPRQQFCMIFMGLHVVLFICL